MKRKQTDITYWFSFLCEREIREMVNSIGLEVEIFGIFLDVHVAFCYYFLDNKILKIFK
jgi:hypothetical protein